LPLNANAAPTVSDYENVYVIQNSEGEVKKVIAVDWLRVEGEGPFSILDPSTEEHRRRFSSVMPLLLKARWG